MMLLRGLMLSVLSGVVFFGMSLGDSAQAAKKKAAKGPPVCMQAVPPTNCTPRTFFYCTKKAKCGSCAKWTCGTFGPKKT
jgi:hypothetical protein